MGGGENKVVSAGYQQLILVEETLHVQDQAQSICLTAFSLSLFFLLSHIHMYPL